LPTAELKAADPLSKLSVVPLAWPRSVLETPKLPVPPFCAVMMTVAFEVAAASSSPAPMASGLIELLMGLFS
jgi:hypothetical protein